MTRHVTVGPTLRLVLLRMSVMLAPDTVVITRPPRQQVCGLGTQFKFGNTLDSLRASYVTMSHCMSDLRLRLET